MLRPDDLMDDERRSDRRVWLWLMLALGILAVTLVVGFSMMVSASAAGGCGGG